MTIDEITVTSARPDSSTYHITCTCIPSERALHEAEDYARSHGAVAVMLLATASAIAWFTHMGYSFVCRCDEDRSLTYLTKIL